MASPPEYTDLPAPLSYLRDRRPDADAAVVEKLREAGAVVIGKTITTELAVGATVSTRGDFQPSAGPTIW